MRCYLTLVDLRLKMLFRCILDFGMEFGLDCVGMSTIPEVVTAHHCGMQVLCLSLITNMVVMEGDEGAPAANHAEVLEAVGNRSLHMQGLVKKIIEVINRKGLHLIQDLPEVDLKIAVDQHRRRKRLVSSSFGFDALLLSAAVGAIVSLVAVKLPRG